MGLIYLNNSLVLFQKTGFALSQQHETEEDREKEDNFEREIILSEELLLKQTKIKYV